MTEQTESPYMDAEEAAAYLKIPVARMKRLAKDGKVEKIKVWGGPYFTVEMLDEFMSKRTVRAKKR